MGFEALLGNRQLKENLRASIRRRHIAHFYLISGPAGSGKRTLARLLAAAILCKGSDAPCMGCPACRKILADTHPDFITVTDPEHKNVAVKIVREIRDDMFILPNEADRKIYLFPQELGVEGQNALLKILEEPPEYGVFILLSENPETLLPTVRSRCTQLQMQSLPEDILRRALQNAFPDADTQELDAAIWRSGGFLGQALSLLEEGAQLSEQTQGFVHSFAHRDSLALVRTLTPMEKWKRDQLIPTLHQWVRLLQEALSSHSGAAASGPAAELAGQRTSKDLLEAIRLLQKAIEYAQSNVSPAAVCGWLVWVLR